MQLVIAGGLKEDACYGSLQGNHVQRGNTPPAAELLRRHYLAFGTDKSRANLGYELVNDVLGRLDYGIYA